MASKNLFTYNQSTTNTDLVGYYVGGATPNPGVQTSTGGGVTISRSSVVPDPANSVDGTGAALKAVADGTGTFQALEVRIPVASFQAGQTYTFSVWVKATVGTPTLRFYCQSDAGSIGTVGTISPTATYARYTVTATLPADLSGVAWVGLRLDTGSTAQSCTVWLDQFQAEAGGAATGFVPGQDPGQPTPLTLYGTDAASVTVTTARQFGTTYALNAATHGNDSALGAATGWGEADTTGTASAWAALGSPANPTGNGFLLDTNVLEGQQIVAGNWSPRARLRVYDGATTDYTLTADILARFYVRNQAGIYTFVAQTVLSGQTWTGTKTFDLPALAVNTVPFNAGDRIYMDVWLNVTAGTGQAGAKLRVTGLGPTLGEGQGSWQVVTPGYVPQPPQITRTGGVKIVLAGQDITQYADESTIDLQLALGQGPGMASGGAGRVTSFKVRTRLGPTPLAKGAGEGPFSGTDLVRLGELVVYDATKAKVFGGFVVDLEDATTTLEVQTDLAAVDYWGQLDRIIVNEVYAGFSDTQIIKDLLTKYAPWVDQSAIPATNQYVFAKRFFRARTLRDAIQVIAAVTGYNVWVDSDKVLHYASLGSLSDAPISLSDDPDYVSSFPHTVTKYVQDDAAVVNQVYFYGGKNTSADFTQDLSVQANGNNKNFALLYFPHEAADGKIHIKKNGVDLVMYSTYDTDPTHALKSAGGTADVLLNRDAETLQFDTAPLATDTLQAVYRYQTPLVLVLTSSKSYQKFGQYFQAKIVDQNVYDATTALQRCRVLIAQQGDGLTTMSLVCHRAGVQPGQLLYVKNTAKGIDGTYQVQKVQMRPLGAGFFQWTVDLGAWNWNLVDLLLWQSRTADAADDSVEENESVIQAQEKTLAGTVTVAWNTSVRTSGQYYSRATAVGDGKDAYSGFFSVTS